MSDMPLLGRCKENGCKFALFADESQAVYVDGFSDVQRPGLMYCVVGKGFFSRCPSGHKVFALKRIQGTYSESHKCDIRCMNAKGHDCTCSCGGRNHGRGYAITFDASREPEFIGQIGSRIRGHVTVIGKRELDRYVLYAFQSDQGDMLKWFCPNQYDPEWEQGEDYTVRALVRDHVDDQWGKFTKVTYVEKVE